MKLSFVMICLFAPVAFAINSIKLELEDYKTEIFFTHSESDPWRGTIVNKTDQFGLCEGWFFLDIQGGSLKLDFEEACSSQSMKIIFAPRTFEKIANGAAARVYYEHKSSNDPRQAVMQICN